MKYVFDGPNAPAWAHWYISDSAFGGERQFARHDAISGEEAAKLSAANKRDLERLVAEGIVTVHDVTPVAADPSVAEPDTGSPPAKPSKGKKE